MAKTRSVASSSCGGGEVCLALLDGLLVAHQLLGPVDQPDTEAADARAPGRGRAPACSTAGALLPMKLMTTKKPVPTSGQQEPEGDHELGAPLAPPVDVSGVDVVAWFDGEPRRARGSCRRRPSTALLSAVTTPLT